MLLSITTTHRPATDLGHLLRKHPDHVRTIELGAGTGHVFWPEAGYERATACLLLEIDPVRLGGGPAPSVDDRPYTASALLASAITTVFAAALAGRCPERPGLADRALPLLVHVPTVPARCGAAGLARLFEPLGWRVDAAPVPLDPMFPHWGEAAVHDLTLRGEATVRDLLAQLVVLLPVLDDADDRPDDRPDDRGVGRDRLDELLHHGGRWLEAHPERDLIARRQLGRRPPATRASLARLVEGDPDRDALAADREEAELEAPLGLAEARLDALVAELEGAGARRVVDLRCGEGALVRALLERPQFERVVGVDASLRNVEAAARALRLDRRRERDRARVELVHGSLGYRDRRLERFDAAVLSEAVEHTPPGRLAALEQAVFGCARPGLVLVTTPNAEYNPRLGLGAGGATRRHRGHRFEWSRAELAAWAEGVGDRHGYRVRGDGIGERDERLGPPTQLAVFSRLDPARSGR
ncbi:MAG: 3' terminal RNA ribose 2'-O-methyltransferase Hen1 [Acidimicrobiales bacterium]